MIGFILGGLLGILQGVDGAQAFWRSLRLSRFRGLELRVQGVGFLDFLWSLRLQCNLKKQELTPSHPALSARCRRYIRTIP